MTRIATALAVLLLSTAAFAQTPVAPVPPSPPPSKGCLAVADAGSHALRNMLLAGVAGAIISKKQYKVVASEHYPAHVGQKFHGNDLQTLQTSGVRIIILDKKFTPDEAQEACR